MYCPKCAAENLEGVSFCRACGTDIHLVPRALTGTLPAVGSPPSEDIIQARRRHRREKEEGPPTLARGVEKIFTGLGFLFVALAVAQFMPGGQIWWFWMLIPAFALLGGGVSQLIQARQQRGGYRPPALPPERAPAPTLNATSVPVADLPHPRQTAEITQPPSVTEATTRHLKTNVKTKEEEAGQNF